MTNKSNTIDLEQIKFKLYEKLKASGWGDKLKSFILSEDFSKILNYLAKDVNAGNRFTPVLKQVFRAFEECPYEKLKVVMLGQAPYPYQGVADGIAFSCSNDNRIQASLRYILKEVEDTVYSFGHYSWQPDLKHWSNQGVLMLNSALTTTIGKVGQHYDLWKPFITFLLDILTHYNPGLVYVFMGKKAEEFIKFIPNNNHKLITTHPAYAAHTDSERWNSNDVFNSVNKILMNTNNEKIIW